MEKFNYQKEALRTEARPTEAMIERSNAVIRLNHACYGMVTEAGEFFDALKRFVYYGAPLDRTNLREELGDLMWYIAIAADELGTTLDEIERANIAKLHKRFPEEFSEIDALNRDLPAERMALEGVAPGNSPEGRKD